MAETIIEKVDSGMAPRECLPAKKTLNPVDTETAPFAESEGYLAVIARPRNNIQNLSARPVSSRIS